MNHRRRVVPFVALLLICVALPALADLPGWFREEGVLPPGHVVGVTDWAESEAGRVERARRDALKHLHVARGMRVSLDRIRFGGGVPPGRRVEIELTDPDSTTVDLELIDDFRSGRLYLALFRFEADERAVVREARLHERWFEGKGVSRAYHYPAFSWRRAEEGAILDVVQQAGTTISLLDWDAGGVGGRVSRSEAHAVLTGFRVLERRYLPDLKILEVRVGALIQVQ